MSSQHIDFKTYTLVAGGADLDDAAAGTGDMHKAIDINSSDISVAGGLEAVGLLQAMGKSGEHVTVGYEGVMKFVAGAALTPGDRLTTAASGYLVAVASGDYVVGMVGRASVGSGAVGQGLFSFATKPIMADSGESA